MDAPEGGPEGLRSGWVGGSGAGVGERGHSPFYILQLPINRPMAALLVVVSSLRELVGANERHPEDRRVRKRLGLRLA